MLVICEDCAKKYNIDESKIKGNRARFTCNECGHIIIVNKSDLSRPLVHSAEQDEANPTTTIDLLKEMEAPLETPSSSQESDIFGEQNDQQSAPPEGTVSTKPKRSMPIPGYFLIGGIVSFLITNAGFAYVLMQYSSVIGTQQKESQFDMLITAVLVMVVTWAISFIALFVLGSQLSKTVNDLVSSLHQVNMGDKDTVIEAKGPRELAEMAQIISELISKIR